MIIIHMFHTLLNLYREIRKEEVALHDIFRAIPNPTEGLDEERTASITGSVQAMGLAFSSNTKILQVIGCARHG